MSMRETGRRTNLMAAAALLLLALCLLCGAGEARAQWASGGGNTTTTDNVGVGTNAPAYKIDIKAPDIRFGNYTYDAGATRNDAVSNILYIARSYGSDQYTSIGPNYSHKAMITTRETGQWVSDMGAMIMLRSSYTALGSVNQDYLDKWAGGSVELYYKRPGATVAPYTSLTKFYDETTTLPAYTNLRPELGFILNSAGNVGIGTASPSRRLDVSVTTTGGHQGMALTNTNGRSWWLATADSTGNGAAANGVPGNGFAVIDWTVGKTRLAIDGAGNVGVGTTSPVGRLHVTQGSNSWYFLGGDSPNHKGLNAGANWVTANGTQLTFNAYGGGTELITEFGPNYAVHGATGIDRYAMNGGKKSPVIQMSADAGSISLFGESGSGANWRTPTLNLGLHVSAGGNVGVGTASPGYRLDVAGAVRSSSGGFVFPDGTVQTTAAAGGGSQWAATSGGVTGIQYGGGSVGVGTPSPAGKFEVAGGSIFMGDMGNPGWGNVIVRGRVFSSSHNLHLSPPGGKTVYINSDYREAGGEPGPVNLDVSGSITGGNIQAKYQDVAEWVPSVQKLAPGTVVVLDAGRTNHVLASSTAYDTKVAGVVSAEPGVILGVAGEGKLKVATTGRVKVKVDATRGAIHVGDLLVTSGAEGAAMKSVPVDLGGTPIHRPGTIIGKALEPLEKGVGEILVLLSLQ